MPRWHSFGFKTRNVRLGTRILGHPSRRTAHPPWCLNTWDRDAPSFSGPCAGGVSHSRSFGIPRVDDLRRTEPPANGSTKATLDLALIYHAIYGATPCNAFAFPHITIQSSAKGRKGLAPGIRGTADWRHDAECSGQVRDLSCPTTFMGLASLEDGTKTSKTAPALAAAAQSDSSLLDKGYTSF